MSKLLIQESPLTFQTSLAVAIGLNEAIVLQQIHYWISNVKNKGYEQDGYKWVYNTYAEWKETNFPFWSENTIQRTFASLEEKGLVVSIQPMKGKYDRTKYYRIEHTKLEVFEDTKLVRSLNESENTTENTTNVENSKKLKTDEEQPPYNLSEEEIRQVNKKVDKILELNQKQALHWKGREYFAEVDLPYADWYHEKTNQVCSKKVQRSWQKAFLDWYNDRLEVRHLQAAYDQDIVWRKVFTDPNELTKKAVALKAMMTQEEPKQRTESSGHYA